MALANMPVGKARKKFYSDLMSVFAAAEEMCYGIVTRGFDGVLLDGGVVWATAEKSDG